MYDRDHIEKPTSRKVEATFSPIHVKRCLECRTPLAGSGGRDVYCAKCRSRRHERPDVGRRLEGVPVRPSDADDQFDGDARDDARARSGCPAPTICTAGTTTRRACVDARVLPDLRAEGADMSWLALLVGFLACLIVPSGSVGALAAERLPSSICATRRPSRRSATTTCAPVRVAPIHKRTAIRAGVVK